MRSSGREPHTGRLILVANRLPISARTERGELVVSESTGGLATGLRGLHEREGSLWIGWPGETWRLDTAARDALGTRLAELRCVPVELTAGEVERYYESFSNGVLWPLLHYEVDRLPMHPRGWETYRRVNERFADAIVAQHRPGDTIWVHDYQLMLVPALVRRRLPDAAIGFFCHVPFPSSELFRVLPWRGELLQGMLGATLVGFHTASYARHFLSSAARILGCETRGNRVRIDGRSVRVGEFPMGIDAAAYDRLARENAVTAEAARVRRTSGNVRLIVSVDRLDYTKGIPRRLLMFERLLERYPSLRGRVRLIQVAAPSREAVGAYREYRRDVDELVGRINGRFATLGDDPIRYIARSMSRERLVALYRAATVALVTPLRDGMNLVAKEFVASRVDDDGVLVLSEFAGAAAEMSGALLVNPYDVDGVAAAVRHALSMRADERHERMRGLRTRVLDHDVLAWAGDFLGTLRAEHRRAVRLASASDGLEDAVRPAEILAELERDGRRPLTLLLDYDGTLVPLKPRPEDAWPDDDTLRLLATLAGLPEVTVHVTSGRRREDLERWLGHLPLGLHAEHGLWSRFPGQPAWTPKMRSRPTWLESVRHRMEARTQEVPGSFVEEKDASLAWHYRNADPALGERGAEELRRALRRELRAVPGSGASVVDGNRVLEVREAAVHKGVLVHELVESAPATRLLIAGDDATDEDMFAAAPPSAITIRVGAGRTRAGFRVAGPDQVRALLAELARRRGGEETSPPPSADGAAEEIGVLAGAG
ncbi:MAG: bifunctional alpha,alpha-trehalose-phosphate synthase (UDP-forming)/trehalose-phosphatase [Chloroflexi bacterium]|nr:MAG: bifunctional alpha,alpha-trehalose-phosphate synthase (UDP-forming)/trehalose-phosphatase [Chloroflexota bacterium]